METANILLNVGSDGTNILSKSNVTPAEIAVLRLIHGDDAVTEIEVLSDEAVTPEGGKRTHRQEIARLTEIYGKPLPEGGREARAVNALFPGAAARVFETFEELELPDDHYKTETRASAKPKRDPLDHDADGRKGGVAPATPLATDLEKMTIPKLKELADQENIDLGGATSKKDIISSINVGRGAAIGQAGIEQAAGVNVGPHGEPIDEDEDDDIGEMTDRQTSVFE